MTTPSGVTIQAIKPNGEAVDITEAVQVLYDHVIGSMDWGSGFLTIEDAVPIAEVAHICGFEKVEETDRYLVERARENRRNDLLSQTRPDWTNREQRNAAWTEAIDQAKAEIPDVETALQSAGLERWAKKNRP